MEEDDLKKKVEEDFDWLVELFPQLPEVTFLEPIVQSLAIFNAANNISLQNEDLLAVAMSGFVATRARVVDEERFMQVDPHTYLQFAYMLTQAFMLNKETDNEDYKEFMRRIHINNEQKEE